MRQLHPVSFHEGFVASGTYVWSQNGVANGDHEHWTLHEPGEGAWSLRADYDGRAGTGVNWLFEGFYNRAHRRVERYDLSVFGRQHTEAKFIFSSGEVSVHLRVDGMPQPARQQSIPPDTMPQPPALIGAFLFAASPQSRVPAFVADIDFISGTVPGERVETLTVADLGPDTVAVDGGMIDARRLRLTGDDGRDEQVWLDAFDVALRWQNAAGCEAVLTRYVHRPETTS